MAGYGIHFSQFFPFHFAILRSKSLAFHHKRWIAFGVVFIVTDPVSMPKHPVAIWIFGILVGF